MESEISLTQKVCNCYEIMIMKYHVLSICIQVYIGIMMYIYYQLFHVKFSLYNQMPIEELFM